MKKYLRHFFLSDVALHYLYLNVLCVELANRKLSLIFARLPCSKEFFIRTTYLFACNFLFIFFRVSLSFPRSLSVCLSTIEAGRAGPFPEMIKFFSPQDESGKDSMRD